MLVKELLKKEKNPFHTIGQEETVAAALKLMSGYNISALLVMDDRRIAGIFTERDLLRCHVIFPEKNTVEIQVREVMTHNLIVAEPDDEIKDAMGMMIKAKIRHLPVIENAAIKGILALEDLVKNHVGALTQELHYLQDYVTDLQDAAQD
ncbi:IMP dehydrogenase [Desulfocicer vacuolatum DSM 3385]|uniref:IMP dehydrogenase n=1 Tax=Desulfocicer vacuolatum DSM 3385 TaxID=1121400 RepID=A0A1W1YNX9_9BACT|nr:CBS domain-containing protein [Desulfocicer vacuolatum]SMC37438.1 IMP dehydrogenase [Desulfocicer vacuolatum DSM 3385]